MGHLHYDLAHHPSRQRLIGTERRQNCLPVRLTKKPACWGQHGRPLPTWGLPHDKSAPAHHRWQSASGSPTIPLRPPRETHRLFWNPQNRGMDDQENSAPASLSNVHKDPSRVALRCAVRGLVGRPFLLPSPTNIPFVQPCMGGCPGFGCRHGLPLPFRGVPQAMT
jgi:hypothetical protein